MELWTFWLIIGLVLLIGETLTTTVWLLCLSIGAMGALIASLCNDSLLFQCVIFAVLTILACIFLLPWLKKKLHRKPTKVRDAVTNADAMIGRKVLVTHEILPGEKGRVKLDGESWQAKALNPSEGYPVGSRVTIKNIDSIVLIVE